jgi:hypothetical protein
MGTAVAWDYITSDPECGVRMPERELKRPHRFLTPDEVVRLIAASEEPTHTIVVLVSMTACALVKSLHCDRDTLI